MTGIYNEVCKNMAETLRAYASSKSGANKFLFELAYAAYQSECKRQGITPISIQVLLNNFGSNTSKVVYIPFK